jgi:hypothetical protein
LNKLFQIDAEDRKLPEHGLKVEDKIRTYIRISLTRLLRKKGTKSSMFTIPKVGPTRKECGTPSGELGGGGGERVLFRKKSSVEFCSCSTMEEGRKESFRLAAERCFKILTSVHEDNSASADKNAAQLKECAALLSSLSEISRLAKDEEGNL